MSKRLDGTSMFTGINSGLTNSFSQLSNQYGDGLTLENLSIDGIMPLVEIVIFLAPILKNLLLFI